LVTGLGGADAANVTVHVHADESDGTHDAEATVLPGGASTLCSALQLLSGEQLKGMKATRSLVTVAVLVIVPSLPKVAQPCPVGVILVVAPGQKVVRWDGGSMRDALPRIHVPTTSPPQASNLPGAKRSPGSPAS
jgi:hypothetical protein